MQARTITYDWDVTQTSGGRVVAIEYLFWIFIAYVLAGGIFTLENVTTSTADGNSLRQVIYLLILGLIVAQAKPFQRPGQLLVLPVALTMALAWCWLSVSWSNVPAIAIRRIALTTMIIFTVFLAVSNLGAKKTLLIVTHVTITLLVVNVFVALLLPSIGVHHSDEFEGQLAGDWRGLLLHKNFAGSVTAFTILLCWFNPANLRRATRFTVLALATFFLWRTNSKTSMGLIPPSILFGAVYARYRTTHPLALKLGLLSLAAVGAAIIAANQETIAAAFDEQDTLTGRVQIWPVLAQYCLDHPLFGSGYGSFWNAGSGSPIYVYSDNWISEIASGHQGYLDILAQIGFPGLLLVLYATIIGPLRAVSRLASPPPATIALLLAILAFCVGHNLTESSILDRDANVNLFLMLAIAIIEAERRSKVGTCHRAA